MWQDARYTIRVLIAILSVPTVALISLARSAPVHDPLQLAALSLLSPDKRPQPRTFQPSLTEVLSWLPADTETVIGANGPFPVPDLDALPNDNSRQPELLPRELELRMRTLALGLFGFKNGGLQGSLKGQTVALAVEGSRGFRHPAALGAMLYEGCEIAVLNGAVTLDRDSFMKNAAGSAKRFENVGETRIAVFEEGQEDDVWTTFVAFPRSNVVLVATNGAYLRTVLARIRGAGGPRALPDNLPEWNYVNTSAPTWGVRHFQRGGAVLDPTSPYQGHAAANVPDNGAVGVTFWFEPVNRKLANVTYLSANSNARQILEDHFNFGDADSEFQIRLRERAPGVIEGSVALSRVEALYHLFFGLSAMLGHAVYI